MGKPDIGKNATTDPASEGGSYIRFRGERPGDDVVPLSPTIAHGFRIHDVV